MAGLVPAIHVFACGTKDVDARAKRGHDGRESGAGNKIKPALTPGPPDLMLRSPRKL
jgi:hypothetical protein